VSKNVSLVHWLLMGGPLAFGTVVHCDPKYALTPYSHDCSLYKSWQISIIFGTRCIELIRNITVIDLPTSPTYYCYTTLGNINCCIGQDSAQWREGRGGMFGTVGGRSPGCFSWVLPKRSISKPDQHRKYSVQQELLGTDIV